MDIDEVEAWLAKTLPVLLNDEFTPTDTLLLAVECQVLLHLYHVIVARLPAFPGPPVREGSA